MTETGILPAHRQRQAFVYIRQSSPAQVERNTESTRRQYALAARAETLGWHPDRSTIVDEDLGLSGESVDQRDGFNSLAADVALGRAGIVLGLEVSRLARNNADWYRLLDLCALTDTLIADFDGIYDPARFNDRLLLGMKGTISEAELHTLKVRLLEGIRNKAARGEFRCTLPVGFVWGARDGEVRFHPDEEVVRAIRNVFERFAALGSMRRVWLWFRDEGLQFPVRLRSGDGIRWIPPAYSSIVQVLRNPVYAGAYAFGKSRQERYLDEQGRMQKRLRRLPRAEWRVLLPGHHRGYLDWETFEANRARIATNRRPRPHSVGGTVREGSALLQGLAICGNCGRPLRTYYLGRLSSPNYHCPGQNIVEGRATYCLQIGGTQVDQAVAASVLEAVRAGGTEAALRAIEQVESDHDAARAQRRLAVERAAYEATRAERAYRAVDPENRRVARGLEREWEQRLEQLERERAELALRERECPRELSAEQREALLALGEDLPRAWNAPTTTARDRKELLRALLEEVLLDAPRNEPRARIRLLWRGGLSTELSIERPRNRPPIVRTDEATIELLRRLAAHYPDTVIAGILNRQGHRTAYGLRFTQSRVSSLRTNWKIPCCKPSEQPPDGQVLSVRQAAKALGVAPSTIHRMLHDGFLAGDQITPGAPWRIRLTDELRQRFVQDAPEGYVAMQVATARLGVSRQTVLEWIKRGKLEAVTVLRGRRGGLRIRLPADDHPSLFEESALSNDKCEFRAFRPRRFPARGAPATRADGAASRRHAPTAPPRPATRPAGPARPPAPAAPRPPPSACTPPLARPPGPAPAHSAGACRNARNAAPTAPSAAVAGPPRSPRKPEAACR